MALPTRTSNDPNAAADINDLQTQITALSALIPVGTILPYAGATAPTGFLICDGKTLGRDAGDTIFPDSSGSGAPDVYGTQYETLYGILSAAAARWEIPTGTATWGTHKIKLPNLQDAFLRGEVGGATSIFTDSTNRSAGIGKKQDDAVQGHTHQIYDASSSGAGNSGIFSSRVYSAPTLTVNNGDKITIKTDGTNGTPRTATESRPKNVGVNYIIKY